jgi:hypothetical protein
MILQNKEGVFLKITFFLNQDMKSGTPWRPSVRRISSSSSVGGVSPRQNCAKNCTQKKEEVGCRRAKMRDLKGKEKMRFLENLLYVRLYFGKVSQHIYHDSVPLFMKQDLDPPKTFTSKLSSKMAESRLIFANIVMRRWVYAHWEGSQHNI